MTFSWTSLVPPSMELALERSQLRVVPSAGDVTRYRFTYSQSFVAAGGTPIDIEMVAPLEFRARSVTHRRGVVASAGQHHTPILEQLQPLADAWLRRP